MAKKLKTESETAQTMELPSKKALNDILNAADAADRERKEAGFELNDRIKSFATKHNAPKWAIKMLQRLRNRMKEEPLGARRGWEILRFGAEEVIGIEDQEQLPLREDVADAVESGLRDAVNGGGEKKEEDPRPRFLREKQTEPGHDPDKPSAA